jgi:hypothetical protein
MTDLTYIKNNEGRVYVRGNNKIYQFSKITNTWVTVGLVNEKIDSSYNTIIGLKSSYDSIFNPLQNAIVAQLQLTATDSDGNAINWVSSSSSPIVDVAGNSPEFSFVPRKQVGDESLTAIISFEGTVNPTGVDSCPKFKLINSTGIVDSGFTIDSLGYNDNFINSLKLDYFYNWETAELSSYNADVLLSMSTFTVPLIQYLAEKTTKSTTEQHTDLQFNLNGSMVFFLDGRQNQVLSYELTIPYDISTIDHTTEKKLNLYNDTWRAADASAFKFELTGLKLFVIDKTINQIAEYWLTNAYDLHTAYRKDNFKSNFSELNNQADNFLSPDGKYYYTLDKPSISAQTGSWYRQYGQVINGGVIKRWSMSDSGEIYTLSVDSADTGITTNVEHYQRIYERSISSYSSVYNTYRNGSYYWTRYTNQLTYRYGAFVFVTYQSPYERYHHYGLAQSICFNSSGTRMIVGHTIAATHGRFVEYRLSIPWDPSSREDPENKYGTNLWTTGSTGPSIGPTAVGFPDGMHTIGTKTANELIEEPSQNYSNTRLPHGPESIRFSPDDSKFYVLNKKDNEIYQYNIPAPIADSEYSIYNLTTPIASVSKEFNAGGYDLRILLNTLDSVNSRLGNDLDTFHSINIVDSNKMFVSGNEYIHTIELNSYDLVSNLIKSDSNPGMTSSNNIASVNTFEDKLYVHDETGTISQWKMNTLNDPATAVIEYTQKIITLDSNINPAGLAIDWTDSINAKFYIGGDDIIQKYTYNSGLEGMSKDSSWNYILDSSSIGIPIANITGMTFADSNGRLNVSGTNRIFQINLDNDLLHNSKVDSNSYAVASPAGAEAHGISWWPGGDKFNITGRVSSSSTSQSSAQTFETKNSYSVKSI